MAYPAFRAVGTIGQGTGDVVPGLPSGLAANDVMLLVIESGDPPNSLDPVGWTDVLNSPNRIDATDDTTLEVKWRRVVDPALEVAPTITDRGNHTFAVIAAYSGVITSGDPWDVTAVTQYIDSTQQTGIAAPSVTTSVAECLVTDIRVDGRDAGGGRWAAHANANLTGLAERFDEGTAFGHGGGIGLADGGLAAAGASGQTTANFFVGAVVSKIIMTLALRPPAAGGAPTPARRRMLLGVGT